MPRALNTGSTKNLPRLHLASWAYTAVYFAYVVIVGIKRVYAVQSRSTVRRGTPRTASLYHNPDSPEASGGGSLGYNQNLWNW